MARDIIQPMRRALRLRAPWLLAASVLMALVAIESPRAQAPAPAPASVPGAPPAAGPGPLTGVDLVRATYTKYEYQVPMRDGTRLFTAVYVPKDTSQKYPLLMIRTQSGVRPYGVDQYPNDLGPSPLFGKAGYIFVYQDIRGRWMSQGTFVNVRPHNPAKKG